MSVYVYEVFGPKPVTVETGLDVKNLRFFANVYGGSSIEDMPKLQVEGISETVLSNKLERLGVPMSLQAYDLMNQDARDLFMGDESVGRRYSVLHTVLAN